MTNDNGGTALPTAWTLTATGPTPVVTGTGPPAITNRVVSAGTYALTESAGPPGYTPGAWSCTGGTLTGSSVVVPNGGNVTCTINNNDQPASLTLIKTVTNDNGGTAVPTNWTLTATGPTTGVTGTVGQPPITNRLVTAGSYALSESTGPAGYTPGPWSCTGATVTGSTVAVPLGGTVTCTIDNNDDGAELTLVKEVVNGTTGGTAVPGNWTLTADGPTPVEGNGNTPAVTGQPVDPGDYTLSESGGPAGYTAGEWSCVNGGDPAVPGDEITVSLGDDWTCRITNTAEQATLRLVKSVANGTTGGTAVPTDWDMSATGGPTAVGPTAGDTGIVDVAVGSYDLAESAGPDGYTAGDWSCVNGTEAPVTGDQVTVELGDAWVCTITNTADQPTLRLIKSVDNGNTGGTAVPTDWDLSATGGPTAVGPTAGDTGIVDVAIGSYDLAESAGPDGYTAGDWSCVNGTEAPVTGDQVTVELGDAWVCTITNTADQATLQLIKVVDNGTSGQTATAADWNLSATGPTAVPPTAGGTAVLPVSPGAYALAEAPAGTADVSGYVPGAWSCANEGGTPVTGASVTVALGDAWVCTIVNTALYPATVDKTAESAVQDITTGDWTVTYTLDVTNPNPDDPITYDLSDELRFPAAATVNGITVTPPAGVTVNAGFDGDADQVIATGVALPAGATQTYTVVVDVTVTEPLPPPDRECETPGPGTASTTSAPSPATVRPTRTRPASTFPNYRCRRSPRSSTAPRCSSPTAAGPSRTRSPSTTPMWNSPRPTCSPTRSCSAVTSPSTAAPW